MDVLRDVTNRPGLSHSSPRSAAQLRRQQEADYAASLHADRLHANHKAAARQKAQDQLTWRLAQHQAMLAHGQDVSLPASTRLLRYRVQVPLASLTVSCTFPNQTPVHDAHRLIFTKLAQAIPDERVRAGEFDALWTAWEARALELVSKHPAIQLSASQYRQATLSQTGVPDRSVLYLQERLAAAVEDGSSDEESVEEEQPATRSAPPRTPRRIVLDDSSEESNGRAESSEASGDSQDSGMEEEDQVLMILSDDESASDEGSEQELPGDLASVLGSLIKRTEALSLGRSQEEDSSEDQVHVEGRGQWIDSEEEISADDSDASSIDSFLVEDSQEEGSSSSCDEEGLPSSPVILLDSPVASDSEEEEADDSDSDVVLMLTPSPPSSQRSSVSSAIELLSDSEEDEEEAHAPTMTKTAADVGRRVSALHARPTSSTSPTPTNKALPAPRSFPVRLDAIQKIHSQSQTPATPTPPSSPTSPTALGAHLDRLTLDDDSEEESDTTEIGERGEMAHLNVNLLTHQIAGVQWMVSREKSPAPCLFGGGILADDMGLGKTVQTIATVLAHPSPHAWKSTLVVCTLSTVSQWQAEIQNKVTPAGHLNVCLYYGNNRESDPYALATADVVLTTYGVLQSEYSRAGHGAFALLDEEKIPRTPQQIMEQAYRKKGKKSASKNASSLFKIRWWRVVLDEAQYIKNRNTGKHKAAVRLEAYHRWCLTGTPIQNELKDIWSLLHFIRVPKCENLRYFNTLQAQMKSAHCQPAFDELHRLIDPLLLRREKAQLKEEASSQFSDLPPCTIERVYLDLSPDEMRFYRQLWEKAQSNFNEMRRRGTVLKNYMHIFEQILRLRQVCDHPYLLMENSTNLGLLCRGDDSSESLMILNMQWGLYMEALREEAKSNPSLLTPPTGLAELGTLGAQFQRQGIELAQAPTGPCTICCDEYQQPVQTACGHYFCSPCMEEWAATSTHSSLTSCPVCRTPLGPHQIRAVRVKPTKPRRRSTMTPDMVQSALVPTTAPSSGERGPRYTLAQLPNSVLLKIFGYVRDRDMHSILALNLTSKRCYAISRQLFSQLALSTKVRALVDHIKQLQEDGKCVVFSQFTRFLEVIQYALVQEGVAVVRLDGSMALSERKKVIDKFQHDRRVRVFIVSLKAAACGLNLTAGKYVFMLDPWWNGAIEQQAIDRVHRYGQKNPVTVYRYIIRDSIEENLLTIQERKLKISSLVLDEPCANKLSQDDLVTLFTEVRAMQKPTAS